MRTTLNIDSEIMAKVRLLSEQRGVPLGQIVSELVGKALEPRETPRIRNGVPVFPAGTGDRPDFDLVNRLRD